MKLFPKAGYYFQAPGRFRPAFCIGKSIESLNRGGVLHGPHVVGAGGAGREKQESGGVRGEVMEFKI